MLTDMLFPAELQLRVDGIEMEQDTVDISVTSANGRSVCPHCQTMKRLLESKRACLKAAADRASHTEASVREQVELSVSNTEQPSESTEAIAAVAEFPMPCGWTMSE